MTQYLLSIYQPDGPPPADLDLGRIMADVRALNDDMKKAGAWVFSAGLCPASTATVIRVSGGDPLMTDGPYTEGKEHLGGFCIVKAADLDAALDWGRKLARVVVSRETAGAYRVRRAGRNLVETPLPVTKLPPGRF